VHADADPRKQSQVFAKPPCVMLVRIAEGEEPRELGLREMRAKVLRVRHPLPACERIRVLRPSVVVVGPNVRSDDLAKLAAAARDAKAAILQLGPLVSRELLGGWLRTAIDIVRRRRAQGAERSKAG
jgi:hypothetical protein